MLSQTDKAFRDTTISRSAGEWFRIVVDQFGIPRDGSISENAWRDAARTNAYGARGTYGATLAFVEAALQDFNIDVDVTVDPANPQRLTAATPGSFTQQHIGRWVRVDGTLYQIAGPSDITTSSGNWVTLEAVPTTYWSGANFTAIASTTASILPFVIREPSPSPSQPRYSGNACLVQVYIYDATLVTPPTYLQPGAAAPPAPSPVAGDPSYNGGSMDPVPNVSPLVGAEARPAGQPFGGHLMQDETVAGDQTSGPFPIYLVGEDVFPEMRNVLDILLAAGVRAEMKDKLVV